MVAAAKTMTAEGKEAPLPNRIKEHRMLRGMSLSELSELTGLTRSELHKLEKGVRRLRTDHLPILSRALRVSPEQLLSTELAETLMGNRLKYGSGSSGGAISAEAPTVMADLPILGTYNATGTLFTHDDQPQAFAQRIPQLVNVKGAYALYMTTTRMEPRIPVGALLYVNPLIPVRPGDIAVARKGDGATEVVMVERTSSGGMQGRMQSPEETMDLDNDTKLHRVVGVIFS
ncbi:MAG: helix-turn-helix domain-containing protein [Dongiaceae bacterium]